MSVQMGVVDKARFLNLVASNPTPQHLDRIAGDFGLLYGEALDIVSKHGWPRASSMRRAAELLLNPRAEKKPSPALSGLRFDPGPDPDPGLPDFDDHQKEQKMSTPTAPVKEQEEAALTDLDVLLERAATSPFKRTQAAGRRAKEAVEALRALIQDEADKREAREKVQRLEEELRKAKAALKGEPDAPTTAGDAKAIREWARDHEVDCPKTGRVPAEVRAQYDAAMGEAS